MRKYLAISIIATLAVLAMCGCGAYKRKILATCPQVSQTTITSTTSTVIDTIKLSPDSAIYRALIECQNGKPVVVSEWVDNGVYLDIASAWVPGPQTNANTAGLMIKALKPITKHIVPKTTTTTSSSYIKEAKQACPPCKHWPWYYWLLIGVATTLLLPKITHVIRWALSFIPGLQFLKPQPKSI